MKPKVFAEHHRPVVVIVTVWHNRVENPSRIASVNHIICSVVLVVVIVVVVMNVVVVVVVVLFATSMTRD